MGTRAAGETEVTPLDAIARLERNTRRVAEIAGVAAKYGLADWLKSIPYARLREWLTSADGTNISELGTGERLRLAATELGTTFIKLGQMLSIRPDLIGPELADELAQLQSRTPPNPAATAWRTFEEDLRQRPEDAFLEFEAEAFASASIAQVHRARLHNGDRVVVKIRKVDIEKGIQADLSILAGLAELGEKHSTELQAIKPVALVRQFRRMLMHELDFTHERRNLEEFSRRFAHDDTVCFPRVYAELSGLRVLTMECLDGVPGTDREALLATGVDLQEFAKRGAGLFLKMIFRDSFYHADPHPGNLLLLADGAVGVLDCGMTGRLDEPLREEIESILIALAGDSVDELTDFVARLGWLPVSTSRDQLRADLADFVADYAGQSIRDLDLSGALNNLVDIVRRHHIVLPAQVSLLLRTLVLLEGTSRLFSPGFSLAELIQPFYLRAVGRRLSPRRLLARFQRTYRDWDRLLLALPRDVGDVLGRVRAGTFSVRLVHRHLDPAVNRLVLGILTASLFLGSSLLWSMKAPPLLGGVSVFGIAGYMISVHLGWKLLRAVRKSGNVDPKDD
jgi:ubiquinone biosynthesis protein